MSGFERQLIAARAFGGLSDEDKAALEAIPPGLQRTALFDAWARTVTDAQATGATATVPAAMVKRAIHAVAPHLVCEFRAGADSVTITFSRSANDRVRIEGFNRQGDLTGPARVSRPTGEEVVLEPPVEPIDIVNEALGLLGIGAV